MGVVVRGYIDFSYYLSLLLLYCSFYSSIPTFSSFKKKFFVLVPGLFCN